MRCPTLDEITEQTLALLPRGRAWRSHRQGPEPTSVLWQFWRSVSELAAWYVERVCALRLEFWCATQSETRDQWMIEYGLPDICDPFPDLCTKVAAIGGTRCEYYAFIASRAGWSIVCETMADSCGAMAGLAQAGCASPGGRIGGATIVITVLLNESPAYTGAIEVLPYAGNFQAGAALACDPDITPLKCVLDRVVHAHIVINYQIVGEI